MRYDTRPSLDSAAVTAAVRTQTVLMRTVNAPVATLHSALSSEALMRRTTQDTFFGGVARGANWLLRPVAAVMDGVFGTGRTHDSGTLKQNWTDALGGVTAGQHDVEAMFESMRKNPREVGIAGVILGAIATLRSLVPVAAGSLLGAVIGLVGWVVSRPFAGRDSDVQTWVRPAILDGARGGTYVGAFYVLPDVAALQVLRLVPAAASKALAILVGGCTLGVACGLHNCLRSSNTAAALPV